MASGSESTSARVLGIDLGTTNSCVSVYEGGRSRVLPNAEGVSTTPSVVSFDEDGKRFVGTAARYRATTHPEATVLGVKRIMGRRHDSAECLRYAEKSPLRLQVTGDGLVRVRIGGSSYSPEEVSSIILDHLRGVAELSLGRDCRGAVVTVPAYFDDAQRHATKNAGRIAGLEVLRILNEPTAAALAYGLGNERDGLVAIYDFGGGTFDVSILDIDSGVFQVRATAGDSYLGGLDLDWLIAEWALDRFRRMHEIDLSADKEKLQRVLQASESAKQVLSGSRHAAVSVPHLVTVPGSGAVHMDLLLDRDEFEGMARPLVEKTLRCCRRALDDAKAEVGDIDWVIFVGGQTRTPMVAQVVSEFFGKAPLKGINPDEVVAMGAAVMGGLLMGEVRDVVLIDVAPHSLGIGLKGGQVHALIPRNAPIPAEAKHTFAAPAGVKGTIRLNIVQGESETASENRSLGVLELHDLPASDEAKPRIEVTFHIDNNGIVNVAARDLLTGKAANRSIVDASMLSEEELSRMTHDMLTYRARELDQRLLVAERNRAAAMLATTRKLIAGAGQGELWREILERGAAELVELLAAEGLDYELLRRKLDTMEEQLAGIDDEG